MQFEPLRRVAKDDLAGGQVLAPYVTLAADKNYPQNQKKFLISSYLLLIAATLC
jgi:hypothetical protein